MKHMNSINNVFLNSKSTIDILWLKDSLAKIRDRKNKCLELYKSIKRKIIDFLKIRIGIKSNQ